MSFTVVLGADVVGLAGDVGLAVFEFPKKSDVVIFVARGRGCAWFLLVIADEKDEDVAGRGREVPSRGASHFPMSILVPSSLMTSNTTFRSYRLV